MALEGVRTVFLGGDFEVIQADGAPKIFEVRNVQEDPASRINSPPDVDWSAPDPDFPGKSLLDTSLLIYIPKITPETFRCIPKEFTGMLTPLRSGWRLINSIEIPESKQMCVEMFTSKKQDHEVPVALEVLVTMLVAKECLAQCLFPTSICCADEIGKDELPSLPSGNGKRSWTMTLGSTGISPQAHFATGAYGFSSVRRYLDPQ